MQSNKETNFSGFEFLPAVTSGNSIEIFHPFAKLASEYFSNRDLTISYLETGSIMISLDDIDFNTKNILLNELKSFLKNQDDK